MVKSLVIGTRREPSGRQLPLDLVVFGRAAGLHLQESIAEQAHCAMPVSLMLKHLWIVEPLEQ
ncbi:hypothetical protein ACNKHT_03900 [Shigella flexneri]